MPVLMCGKRIDFTHAFLIHLRHEAEEFHMKRAVLYLRVSTLDQTMANQERELRQVAKRASWQIVHVYRDHGISGARA